MHFTLLKVAYIIMLNYYIPSYDAQPLPIVVILFQSIGSFNSSV
jgi:hypothetical protein